MSDRKIKVVIAKPGLDGHDRGAKIIARALGEAGMDVTYTGLRRTPEQVVDAVIEAGADVLGLSFLAGDHMVHLPKIMAGLKAKGCDRLLVVVGGIILKNQLPAITEMGVARVFPPGTHTGEIVRFIRGAVVGNTGETGGAAA